MFHACFLWNFWDASKSSVRPTKHFPQLRQFGQFDEAQSWFVNVRCWFRPPAAAETGQEYMIKKQSYNFAKVIKHIESQRSANGRVLLMSRTLVLSPAMRHVSGAANLPDLKGSQHRSYKLCTNFANMLCGILHDLTVLIVHPPYILCTFFSRWVQNNGVEQFSRLQALDTSPSCTKQVSPGDQ